MRAVDREPGEKPRRHNPPGDDNPVPNGDNPSTPTGGGGHGGGNHGGNHGDGRGGGHHGGDGDRDRHHRGRGHDGDHDRDRHRHRRHHDDNANIYDPANQNASSNGGPRSSVDECDRGYEDGLNTGADDARRGQSYDPQRSHHYKRGGGGLFSIGRSSAAKQEYRECFLRGYEEGFRNYK
jgi:hypothetical protein